MIPSVKINDFHTIDRIEEFERSMDATMYLELGNTVVALMAERTAAGKDVSGNAFAAYSTKPFYAPVARRTPGYPLPAGGRLTKSGKSMHFPGGYKEYKGGIGRGTAPQLSVSGAMLGDERVRATDDLAVIYFATAASAEKAHGHQFGTGHLPRREHFGIKDNQTMRQVEDELVGLITERAARANVPIKG